MSDKKKKRKTLYVSPNLELPGLIAVSKVTDPAMQESFHLFSKDSKVQKFKLDTISKRNLIGPMIVADKPIFRIDKETGEEYDVVFTEDANRLLLQQMMATKKIDVTNYQHDDSTLNNRSFMQEVWIIEDPKNDKANALGWKDLTKGTIMVNYFATDEDIELYNSGAITGYSIEAYYDEVYEKFAALADTKTEEDTLMNLKEKFQASFDNLLNGLFPPAQAAPAKKFESYVLATGEAVEVDEESKAVLIDSKPATEGEHILDDGRILVVDAAGMLVDIKEAAPAEKPEEVPAAAQAIYTEADFAEYEKGVMEKISKKIEELKAVAKAVEAKMSEENANLKKEVADLKHTMSVTPAGEKPKVAEFKDERKVDVNKKEKESWRSVFNNL